MSTCASAERVFPGAVVTPGRIGLHTQAQQGFRIVEHANYIGASFDRLVDLLERGRAPDLKPVDLQESGERQQVFFRLAEHRLDLRQLLAEHSGDAVELLFDVLGVRLGEDRSERRNLD